ncbi:unnamed protein product [Symbiodinium microadriaticum]|nr:unnamed protein product [Symbiodinium microadriaticum]
MGNACSCDSCETDATVFALSELKRRLEGQTKVVQPDPRIDPKVHVTFLAVDKEDGGAVSFSPVKFTLRDVRFQTSCLIEGTKTQLAGAAAAKGAAAGCKTAGVSEGLAKSIVNGMVSAGRTASSAADSAKEMLRLETATQRTVKVDVTVDLIKELNVEEVSVVIKDFRTDVALAEMILSVKTFRGFVERAISAKASEIATRMARQRTDRLFNKALVRAAAATAEAHTASSGGADVLGSLLKEDIPASDEDETSARSLRIAAALHGLSQCPDEFVSPWIHLVVRRLDDPSPNVQHAAKVALGCVGSSCADSIAEGLSTEDPLLRAGLARALGYVGCPNALPYTNMLAKLLDRTVETHAEVRIAAAEALRTLGAEAGKSAASALTDYLLLCEGETGSREMEAAQKALVGLQDVTHELLPRILGDPRPEMKCAALEICEALGSVGAELVDGIVESASCPDDLVRQRTVQALSVVSDAVISNKALPKLLQDPSLLVSKMAVAMAGKLGASAATHAMAVARHLTSFDPDLRRTAAQSLGQLGQLPKSVAKDIASTFKSEKREEVRRLLIQALAAQGAAASPFGQLFHTNLKDPSVPMRAACIHALGCIGEGAADHAPTVVSLALADEDESVRQEGVQALGQLGRPGIFALAARLEDPNAANRRSVLEALQVLCKLPVTQEAGPAVMRALKDSTPEVRGAACMTLALLAAEQVAQESADGQPAEKAEEEDKLYQLKVESGLVRRRGTDQAMLVANKLAGLLEEDDSPEVQAGCLHGLRAVGPNFAGPHAQALAGFAGASSPDFRQTVLLTLGGLQEAAVPFVDLLVSHLGVEGKGSEEDVEVQTAAATALAELGLLAVSAAPLLAHRLFSGSTTHTSDPQEIAERKQAARFTVASALSPAEPSGCQKRPGPRKSRNDWEAWQLPRLPRSDGLDLGYADAKAVAAQRQKQPTFKLQTACIRALGCMGETGATLLTECLERTEPEIQATMLRTLRAIPEALSFKVGQAVIGKLEDSDAEVRQGAVDFLYYAAEAGKADEMISPGMSNEDPYIRHLHVQAMALLETIAAPYAIAAARRLRDPCWSVRTCAIQCLCDMGPTAIPVLEGGLKDADVEVRLSCVEALGRFGEAASDSATALAKCLSDESEMVWHEAFEALTKIGPAGPDKLAKSIQSASTPQVQQRAVDFLGAFGKVAAPYAQVVAGLLGCGAEKLEKSAVAALKSMGEAGAAAVSPILLHPTPPVHDSMNMLDDELKEAQLQRRLTAAAALREFGEDSFGQAAAVAHCLHDPEPLVRKEAVATLRTLSVAGANALGALLDASIKLDVRVLAIDTLGKMGDAAREWIAPLAKCLEDPAPEVRRSAAVALGELANTHLVGAVAEHVELLATGVHDGDALARRRCIETLGKLGGSAKPYTESMAQILEGIDSWNWTPVAAALAELGTATSKHADILADNLAHDARSVRWSAASALSKLGPTAKETIPPLVGFLKSEEVSLRCIGAQALMVIAEGPNSLEESFLPLLSDSDPKVRELACQALAKCGCRQTEMLAEKLTDTETFVRRAAATSLGELGEDAAKHAGDLVELLLDFHTSVSMAAAAALIALGAAGATALMQRLLNGGKEQEEDTKEEAADDDDAEPENGTLERIMLDALQGAPEQVIEPYADVLVVFLAANEPEIRLAAWACLSKVSESAFEFMVKRATDSHIVVRKGVAEAIAFLLAGREVDTPTGMQRKAAETLALQLTDPSEVVRLQACEAFLRIGGPLAEAHISDLARRLQEHDVRVYRSVIDTLGNLGVAAAQHVSLIRARLEAPDVQVRRSAATAMGKMGAAGVPSVPMLVLRLEEDSDVPVKRCAVEALGSLGAFSKQAAAHIAKMHANRLASHLIMNESACIRQACAEALGQLGPPACGCLHELVLALNDSDVKVRRAAAHALAGLGEGAAPEAVAIVRSIEDFRSCTLRFRVLEID